MEKVMIKQIPDQKILLELVGKRLYNVWNAMCEAIEEKYEMDQLWNTAYGEWEYEYKYRRGGKTLCALYAKKDTVLLVIILGKKERDKYEAIESEFSESIQKVYKETKTYRDGKWLGFVLEDKELIPDLVKMLTLKRRPNRK